MAESHSIEEIQSHVRVYLKIFGALLVLTVVTVAVAYLHLPVLPALVLALFIALVKGGLVAGYFMHLIGEQKLILGVLVLTVTFMIFMFILFIAAFMDQDGFEMIGALPHVS